ncbi:MAG: Bug family tripartite tricarboxylate transporter substrate binding protein [Burkholderiales bacterium]
MVSLKRAILLCLSLVTTVAALPVCAASAEAEFPARPVRMLVPYPPGGGLDLPGRAVSEKFAQQTGKQLVLDNRGGAGGLIAGEIVANANPDGYTLLLASNGQISIAPALYPKMPYNPARDLVPVTHFVDTPMFLFANTGFPAKTVKDVIERAKAQPGKIGIALSGVGGVSHLTMELFRQRAGINLLGVPYKGAGAAMVDVASGDVPLIFTTAASGKPLLDSNRIRPIAVAARKRSSALSNVPTFEELGLSGMDAPLWIGMMAPRGTPERIIAKLHGEFAKALASKEVQDRLASQSAEIVAAGPKEFGQMIRRDTERWDKVVKTAGIKIEQ